ncbi:MAG TPA: alanine racemase [Candidatus Acidoferrum sp.]|nr:alanine racemase [Candidatus Acidoferrum sp.]
MGKGRRCWLEIDLGAIEDNVAAVRQNLLPETAFLAIVKGDAYTHGAKVVAKTLDDLDSVDFFGVACYDEAVDVRAGGAKKPILILGDTDPALAREMEEGNMVQCCYSIRYAQKLDAEMAGAGKKLKVHMKIDSGLSRLGIVNHEEEDFAPALEEARQMLRLKNLDFEGIFTHFAKAEDEDPSFTDYQYANFMKMVTAIEGSGHKFKYVHCDNSAGAAFHPDKQCNMIRSGTSLYGYTPNLKRPIPGVKRAIQWRAVISQLKWLRPGAVISYGCTYEVRTPSRIATVGVGYADGLFRELSNNFEVLVNGHRAKGVGRICMDQMMIDVTGIEGVEEGDVVTLFGDDRGAHLDAQELADLLGKSQINMISYITKRVPRVYFRDGKEVAETNYLKMV